MSKLKIYREKMQLTQAQLAEKIGVSPAAIGHYESGVRSPRWTIARKLAQIFNTTLDDLEFGEIKVQKNG